VALSQLPHFMAIALLRSVIQATPNKCESFNNFIKWLFLGNLGLTAVNDRSVDKRWMASVSRTSVSLQLASMFMV